jgi:D-alanyl-D-alanine carboxypeptidase
MKQSPTLCLLLLVLGTFHTTAQTPSAPHRTFSLPSVLTPSVPALPEGGQSFSASLKANTNDPTLVARMQSAVDKALAAIDPAARRGVIVSVIAPGMGQWTYAAGLSDTTMPARTDMRFQIASITKTFTAAAIFQLAEEGRLALDDTITKWLAKHPNIDTTTTVRQLLNHTSGIYDYLNDDPNAEVLATAYLIDPNKVWTPEEILENHVRTPNFKPGRGVRYSNTNYILLGLIIEAITGNSVGDEIHTRFLSRLDLHDTYIGWADTVQGDYMHGWSTNLDWQNPHKQMDVATIPFTAILSSAWTAGGMVSTAGDLVRWTDALYSSKVISAGSLETMLTFRRGSDGLDYGLGAFRYPYYSQMLYGHTGGLLGYNSWMFSAPDDTVSVAILVNSLHDSLDNGMNGFALAILDELYRASANSVDISETRNTVIAGTLAPNPFSDHAQISYTVPARGRVVIEVIDGLGRSVLSVVDDIQEMGRYSLPLNLGAANAGAYFCSIRVGDNVQVVPVQVVR